MEALAMPVSFNNFPQNWRLPLYWVEVDPSQAGLPIQKQPALLVGQMFNPVSGVVDVATPIGTRAQAKALYGEGSQIHLMFERFFDNNFGQEVWGGAVAEPSDGQAATGSITVATPPTDSGTLVLYIAGQRVSLAIAANDTTATAAAKIVAAIEAIAALPVSAALASSGSNEVDLTCKWKGSTGNDIDLRANYKGAYGGEVLPKGMTLTFVAMTGGTSAPDCSALIANMGVQQFDFVAMPFTDTSNISMWDTEYGFSDSGRWGWLRQLYGAIFSARRGEYSDLVIWGAQNNSAVMSFMAVETNSPSPVWEWAAAYCSKGARALLNDPARPLQTLELQGILPAPLHKQFDQSELNSMTTYGLAVQQMDANGLPMILRECTAYQKNAYGQSDDAYELLTTLYTLATLLRNQRQAITSKFPRHKLADDGTRYGVGQAIVTPKVIKAELIAEYGIDEYNGLVENVAAFKANLIVERNANDPNRIDVLYPPDLVNGLRIFAVLAQYRLQYGRGNDQIII
jgi:phage tail sheath gpL-like